MTLTQTLRQWDRRLRAAQSITWGARGLTAGLVAAALIAAAARLWPLLSLPGLFAMVGLWGAMGLLTALLLVWLWPRSRLLQARFFDRQLGLQERFSTAVEIQQGALVLPEWLALEQLADALQMAPKANLAAAFPLRVRSRDWLPAALALALLAAALLLPNPMQGILAERAAVRQAIREQLEELEVLREEMAADPELSEEDRGQLLSILEGATRELEGGELSREEALAELTEAGERLRELVSDEAEGRAAGLQRAAEQMRHSPITSALAQALANGEYRAAAALLEDLSNELGEQLTREEELELAEELAEAAGQLADSNPELTEQLAQAADSIERGDIADARHSLAQASQAVQQAGQQIAASRAAQRAAERVGQSGREVAQAGRT